MSKTVAHFIRKNTQLKASFIHNQILNHINYRPVIIYKYESEDDNGGFADFDNNSIPILSLWDPKNKLSKLLYKYPKLITENDVEKINEFLETYKVDILHFHYGTDAGVYYPFLKQTNIPSVVSFYGYDCSGFPRRLFGYGKHYLKKRVYPHITRSLAMSPDMKYDLLKTGCPERKIVVHYYGTDVKIFVKVSRECAQNEIVNYTIISALVPQKGHIFLLKAFKKAYEINNKIKLFIYGEGPSKGKIADFMNTNNMKQYVRLKGKVIYGSKEHLNALSDADAFIHPSVTDTNGDKEGIPGTIIEAMASGLPVISTYHAGIPHIIENNKTGLLVNEWDIDALAEKISLLVSDIELRDKIGKAGQKYAIENLDLSKKEIELENIYNKLVK